MGETRKYVKFNEIGHGDFFFARDRFHCKGDEGIFVAMPGLPKEGGNAFYFDGQVGKWAHFDAIALVQRYEPSIHGRPADIIWLEERPRFR